MIQFNQFSFAYHRKQSLYNNLDLSLAPGKIYGLFGKNGAGKSTLLKNITGLNRPTSGQVHVNNETPHHRLPSFLSSIYFIPEEVYIPSVSPANFIKTYGGFYPRFSAEEFKTYLNELDVPETKNLTRLSFGQQKKFIISFALACNTQVLVMDEPTNGLDIPSKTQFRKLMARTINDDRTFIISTHQVRDLDHILDHIIIVNNGSVILDQDVYNIAQKIAFNFYKTAPDPETVLALEEVIGGYAVMEKNVDKDETPVNLEQLFNTAVLAPQKIQSVF